MFSCAKYSIGYFNAYGNAARKESVDYVVHLGDYIYENEIGVPGKDERAMEPAGEIVTLYDYRTRFAQYRIDKDLLLAHELYPFITVWVSHTTGLKYVGVDKDAGRPRNLPTITTGMDQAYDILASDVQ